MATTVSLVKDITVGTGSSSPSEVLDVNGVLYFVEGTNLWKIEGNTTSKVTGATVDGSAQLAAFNNTLYFINGTTPGSTSLAKIDGSIVTPVAGVTPDLSSLTVVNGSLYFTTGGGTGLSRTDGTTTSSVSIDKFFADEVSNLIAAGTDTYFTVGSSSLYKTNGTSSAFVSGIDFNSELAVIGSTLYFTKSTGNNGTELWKTSNDTTTLVKDIYLGGTGSNPSNLTVVGSTLYFTANDGVSGTELWKTDGITISRVENINPGVASSNPSELTAVGNSLYFTATNPTNGRELWKTDGTTTALVKDINLGATSSFASNLTAVGNTLYFTAYDPTNGEELWKTDATGTSLVKDINPGVDSSFASNLTAVGNTLYFTAYSPTNGEELWKTDGTTTLVKDINLGSSSSNPLNLTAVGNTLYFDARDGANGRELRKLTPNTAPVVTNVAKIGDSGASLSFASTDFTSRFSDADAGDTLTKIKISTLPTNGSLSIANTAVTLNQELTPDQLASLLYVPKTGFSGADSFGWNGFDGEEYALTGATVGLTIRAGVTPPVIMPPVITPPVVAPPVVAPPVVILPFTTNNIVGTRNADKLRGSSANDRILGKGSDDRLIGGGGNDILIGGRGNDRLTGGAGEDIFVYTAPKNGVDLITDFNTANDYIVITGSRFGGLTAGSLSASQFQVGTAANDSDDRFIYSQSTGKLSFDADGIGAGKAVDLVQLKPNTALTAGNFVIV